VTGQDKEESEFVLIPRKPTKNMLYEGFYEVNEENAAGVWRDMITAWEKEMQSREQECQTPAE
jgi:hypothetical protein